jgi:uncharacterized protein DUF6915
VSNPLVHAERSARRWGGTPEDYLAVHRWFDATKACLADNRHRMVLHNAFGVLLCEQVFGPAITNSAGRRVFIRDIGLQHIREDLGCVPTLADCLAELPLRPWMGGARLARPHPKATSPESEATEEPCPACEGDFPSGLPGVLAQVFEGRIQGRVERCDACGQYPSDEVARQVLEHHLSRQEPQDAGPV